MRAFFPKRRELGPNLGRRLFLKSVGTAGLVVAALPACGYYGPELGPAFEPWNFPADHEDERLVLVQAATLAANPHNTQPWWFKLEGDRIEVHVDHDHSLGAMDPLGREMKVGLGCAIENMMIAGEALGFAPQLELDPDAGEESERVAIVRLGEGPPKSEDFFDVIDRRHTNRGRYGEFPLAKGVLNRLQDQLRGFENVSLISLEGDKKNKFRGATISATKAINADREMLEASDAWFRHTHEEIEKHRDGLSLDSAGLGSAMRFFGKVTQRPSAKKAGEYWLRATEDVHVKAASAFLILATPELMNLRQQLQTGRVYQRIALWIAQQNMAIQPLNQMAERRDREIELDLKNKYGEQLSALLGEHKDMQAQMLFRIGYPFDDFFNSPRRPVNWVVRS